MRPQYPIAMSAKDALSSIVTTAPTLASARQAAGDPHIVELTIEILMISEAEYNELTSAAEHSAGVLFFETVELIPPTHKEKPQTKKPKKKRKKSTQSCTQGIAVRYWKSPAQRPPKTKQKKKATPERPPEQLVLWPPNQDGYETTDPHNEKIRLIEEEGTGRTFGGV